MQDKTALADAAEQTRQDVFKKQHFSISSTVKDPFGVAADVSHGIVFLEIATTH